MEEGMGKKKRVCVTGAGGFVASWLVKLLLSKGYMVHGTVRDPIRSNPSWPQDKLLNEDCWSDEEYCRTTENWYSLSKTLAERNAFDYAAKHGLDVITVCPSWVFGPLLQAKVNSSSLFLSGLLKGDRESMENKVTHFVDVRDVADALLLVYKKTESSGRYICAPHPLKISDLIELLKSMYPQYNYPKNFVEPDKEEARATSEKLKMLGWNCRPLKETLIDTIEYYREAGLLDKD